MTNQRKGLHQGVCACACMWKSQVCPWMWSGSDPQSPNKAPACRQMHSPAGTKRLTLIRKYWAQWDKLPPKNIMHIKQDTRIRIKWINSLVQLLNYNIGGALKFTPYFVPCRCSTVCQSINAYKHTFLTFQKLYTLLQCAHTETDQTQCQT